MGIVEEGEVEILRRNHGHTTRMAALTRGAAFSEGVLLDDLPHSASGEASRRGILKLKRPKRRGLTKVRLSRRVKHGSSDF